MAAKLIVSSFFFFFILFFVTSNGALNVISYGAKPDGKTDSTDAFLQAWTVACGSAKGATIYVPKGRYLMKEVEFQGPCKSRILVHINGTIIAPTDYRALGNSGYWILFKKVDNLIVVGGNLDAKGAGFWDCRKYGKDCPVGARVS
ncbi:hypothetical protein Pint_26353 [Pistacia integerrima]|uniref:Uncharacterized protein n=1 Tax=Pistacia integerrima TaxID=434235 RepID=A0ACC0YD77_9ROSI|nr:hypothetical protein Pint_26353 [Pistacia integerrima]